jgi:lipopolysaccharide transport system permease protein
MAFNCNLDQGYVLGCSSIGGVEKVWVGEYVDNVNVAQDACGIITAITTKYKDLSFLVTFGVQLLMYATTVIYPLSAAPEAYKKYIQLNPMTGIIEAFRFAFLGKGEFTAWSIGYSAVFTLIMLFLGIIIFNKTEKTFVDTV